MWNLPLHKHHFHKHYYHQIIYAGRILEVRAETSQVLPLAEVDVGFSVDDIIVALLGSTLFSAPVMIKRSVELNVNHSDCSNTKAVQIWFYKF